MDILVAALCEGKSVLIHCAAGVGRTAWAVGSAPLPGESVQATGDAVMRRRRRIGGLLSYYHLEAA